MNILCARAHVCVSVCMQVVCVHVLYSMLISGPWCVCKCMCTYVCMHVCVHSCEVCYVCVFEYKHTMCRYVLLLVQAVINPLWTDMLILVITNAKVKSQVRYVA